VELPLPWCVKKGGGDGSVMKEGYLIWEAAQRESGVVGSCRGLV
jgi:hypothetical protein